MTAQGGRRQSSFFNTFRAFVELRNLYTRMMVNVFESEPSCRVVRWLFDLRPFEALFYVQEFSVTIWPEIRFGGWRSRTTRPPAGGRSSSTPG